MIWFSIKGLLRDRHRSLFPLLIIISGVGMCVLTYCMIHGITLDITGNNAKYDTGHVKIMTTAYEELKNLVPNDYAITDSDQLVKELKNKYPRMVWKQRIKFGGLLDAPDENGETRSQGPVIGVGLDLLSETDNETGILDLEKKLVQGNLPKKPGEILISEKFSQTLEIKPGEMATLISSTATGSMAIHNFIIAGVVKFEIAALDRNAILADISDIRYALDMEGSTGEIIGLLPNMIYDKEYLDDVATEFNKENHRPDDEFSYIMLPLYKQNNLSGMLDMIDNYVMIVISGLIAVMSIILWNTGLMSGIRRYGEVGVRIAIGEPKGHVYTALLYESITIGLIGSLIGSALGLSLSYYLQEHGIDITEMIKAGDFIRSNIIRAEVTTDSYFIGFIPGLLATTLGTLMAGIGIFKRETSQLFKELET